MVAFQMVGALVGFLPYNYPRAKTFLGDAGSHLPGYWLAVLAILRWNAEESTTPEPIEEWHRYAFPMFCDRMTNRLGESACRTAKHIDWPAESRYASYTGEQATGERQRLIYIDTHPPTPLRPARRA